MGFASSGVLVVDDDLLGARALARELTARGWVVRLAANAREALASAQSEPSAAVLIDLRMPEVDGISLIERLRAVLASSALYLMSAYLDTASTVRAVRAGADDVLEKPILIAELDARLRSFMQARVALESERPSTRAPAVSAILGAAPAIRAVREQIRTVARYRDLPVLIAGETGTGKELVAQAVHALSETDGPFVPVNCAAIPEHLFESELFGHDAGAFTGARGAHAGLFEVAGAGTLFLDEVGELPSALQPKLLRALETRTFRRVGSNKDVPFRARVISATHRNLTSADSVLRSDLYYRLAGFTIATPPLRERSADLESLAQHFLGDFARRYGISLEFSPRALEALHTYDWPGNVRELRAVVQQSAVLAPGDRVGVAEIGAALRDRKLGRATWSSASHSHLAPVLPVASSARPSSAASGASESLRAMERRTILETWEASGNNLSAAARALGLPRTTLRDRLRKYGLR